MKTIKYLLLILVISTNACNSGKPEGKGWITLFNGINLDGWMVECKPEDKSKGFWTVQDGMILVNSLGQKDHDYVWLTAEKEYTDFMLKFKFAAFKESPGNSGVQVRSRYDYDSLWLDGPQVDINPPEPWRTGMMWDETRGNKVWLYPALPQGEWVDETMRQQMERNGACRRVLVDSQKIALFHPKQAQIAGAISARPQLRPKQNEDDVDQ